MPLPSQRMSLKRAARKARSMQKNKFVKKGKVQPLRKGGFTPKRMSAYMRKGQPPAAPTKEQAPSAPSESIPKGD